MTCASEKIITVEDLEGTYISGMAPKRRFLMGFFFQFSGNKHS